MTDMEYEIASKYMDVERDKVVYRANGCYKCNEGYKDRQAVEEVFILSDEFRDMIRNNQVDLVSVSDYAKSNNFKPMVYNGLVKVFEGLTSFDELINVMYDQM